MSIQAETSGANDADVANAVTLRYAPVRHRSVWRIALRVAVLVTGIGSVGWCGYEAQKRVRALESNRLIGPVDWAAVLQSQTLLKAAWQLSSSPSAIDDYAEKLEAELKPPFRFRDGKAHFDIVIRNRSDDPAVLPPHTAFGTIPRALSCTTFSHVGLAGAWLGNGVRVMAPGESVSLTVSVRANERPVFTYLYVSSSNSMFVIGAGGHRDRYPYGDWSEIPASAVRRVSP